MMVSRGILAQNSRIPCVIAREQSRGSNLLEFPTMSSPSLTGGSLYGILNLSLRILEFLCFSGG